MVNKRFGMIKSADFDRFANKSDASQDTVTLVSATYPVPITSTLVAFHGSKYLITQDFTGIDAQYIVYVPSSATPKFEWALSEGTFYKPTKFFSSSRELLSFFADMGASDSEISDIRSALNYMTM